MSRPTAAVQIAVLVMIGVLLAVMELMFQFAYLGAVPLPMGTLVVLLTMPWLVRTTVEAQPDQIGAALQPVLWFLATAAVGAFGPGGDTLLVPTWQTLLLLASGVLVGLFCFRRAVDRIAAARAEASAGSSGDSSRPLDPRVRGAGRSS